MKTARKSVGLVLAGLILNAPVLGSPFESVRDFCRNRGGGVLETGNLDVHICCYPARQRCLVVNEHGQLSSLVVFPDETSDAATADETIGVDRLANDPKRGR